MPPRTPFKYRGSNGIQKTRAAYQQGIKDARYKSTVAARSYGTSYARANRRTGGYQNMELKFVDYEITATAIGTSWATREDATAKCITATAEGVGESNRDGRKYSIHSIHARFELAFPALESQAAPQHDSIVRVVIVLDKQTNAADVTATDVMNGGGTNDYLAYRNLQNSGRFIILMDKKITMKMTNQYNEGAINLFANGIIKRFFEFNKKFATPIKVVCPGTSAVVGSISDNSIHIIAVASDTLTTIAHQTRCRFTG